MQGTYNYNSCKLHRTVKIIANGGLLPSYECIISSYQQVNKFKMNYLKPPQRLTKEDNIAFSLATNIKSSPKI